MIRCLHLWVGALAGLVVVSALLVVAVLSLAGLSPNEDDKAAAVVASAVAPNGLDPSNAATANPRAAGYEDGEGSHCAKLFTHVAAGRLVDPNNGTGTGEAVHKRLTVTNPPFWISLHNPETDAVRWSIMTHGRYYEFSITENAKTILLSLGAKVNGTNQVAGVDSPNPPLFVDVGMNIGWYSLWARALGSRVVGFEPNPANRLRLCESLRLNGWLEGGEGDLRIFGNAVGERPATLSLVSDAAKNPGAATLVGKIVAEEKYAGRILNNNVTVVRLDDFAQSEGWLEPGAPPIALLKIDVEGQDSQVIFGAEKLIQSGQVRNIFIEYSCGHISKERLMNRLVAQLDSASYMMENIGGWSGSTKKGAKEEVLDGNDGTAVNLAMQLWEFCRKQPKRQSLNLWWRLQEIT